MTGPVELSEGARRERNLAPREEALLQTIDDLSVRLESLVAMHDGSRIRSLTVIHATVGIATTLCILGGGPIFGLSWSEAWWWIVGIVLGFPLVVGAAVWAIRRFHSRPEAPAIEGELRTASDRLERLMTRYERHFGSLDQVVPSLTGTSIAAMVVGVCLLGYGLWEALRPAGLPLIDLLAIGGGIGMFGMGEGVRHMGRWMDPLSELQSRIRDLATEVERLEPIDDAAAARVGERLRLEDELDRSTSVRSHAWGTVRWGATFLFGGSILFLLDGSLVSILIMLAFVGAMTASDIGKLLSERQRRAELQDRLEALDRTVGREETPPVLDGAGSASVVHPE